MSFLTGIIGKTLLEVLKGLFFQIGWKIILERFASRLVVWGLEALRDLSTNDVIQETVDDVIASLQGKRLKEIPQKE
ncbi:hypothetical protein JC606_14315 [Vibrio sp. IB15]|uniref:hypothetical protein n=1 Tax=Vibrio TaxID=662 RepID=UPI000C81B651|nr:MULTISPECIES: hypothetical protein [Vibrio]MBJ2147546.1 hypothetical protein [Vibrio sp. IB15]PMG64898.1 hypothetical protein BCU86_17255 [Vibrio lentus]PMH90737.1 hypothetical protein BCU56_15860 [Vibrio lentus]PMI67326.1 hypothetical protein BCU43_00430 [Vibrio lentus]PMJ15994.1 hypothetical protein BCU29_12155 [Vibrio lentus]